jgi:hypothetical protein
MLLPRQDCFYVDYFKNPEHEDDPGADIFFFDYGVVACWGMTKNQEWTVVRGIAAQVGWGEWSGGEGLKKRPGSETIPKCDGAPCLGTTAHCTIFPHLCQYSFHNSVRISGPDPAAARERDGGR